MQATKTRFNNLLLMLITGALGALALGLVTSTTILSLSHILIIIPSLYFLNKINYKENSTSFWALLFFSLAIILSILFNQDIAVNGFKPLPKVKYFIFGLLMIAPFVYFIEKKDIKKIKILLYLFCISTSVATIAGYVGMKTGFNYISMRPVNLDRNAGLSGMVLNYAHNLAFFQIIILGLILYKEEVSNIIGSKFLYIVFIINLFGIYTSYTRGAMLALLVGAPFYFFKKNKVKFALVTVILAVLSISVYTLTGKSILRPGSDRERISQWQAAMMAFKERPVLGYGYLNFEQHSIPLKRKYNLGELQFGGHAHNNFLEVLSTTGILGFISFMTWLICWFVEVYKRDDLIARISLPLIITFIVGGLTQSTISLGVNLFFIMAAYAISQAAKKTELLKT